MSCKPTVWVSRCDNPYCQGWVHDARGVIQKCDDCQRYSSDASASRAHRKWRTRVHGLTGICPECQMLNQEVR